jgi:hypothetical protein
MGILSLGNVSYNLGTHSDVADTTSSTINTQVSNGDGRKHSKDEKLQIMLEVREMPDRYKEKVCPIVLPLTLFQASTQFRQELLYYFISLS